MLDQTYSSQFQVEQIVDEKIIDGQTHFLVKWVGYDHSENTWEPLRHMTHSNEKIKEWQKFKINQLTLASNKKLHQQVNLGFNINKPSKRNLQAFKNVSNPYKRIYLKIDEPEGSQKKQLYYKGEKIQTIFDQPQLKKLIKNRKSDRKKKQLEMFERRLKTRPKVWEKYLQNQDSVIRRANQKIKQAIDKAFTGDKKIIEQQGQKDLGIKQKQQDKAKNQYLNPQTSQKKVSQKILNDQQGEVKQGKQFYQKEGSKIQQKNNENDKKIQEGIKPFQTSFLKQVHDQKIRQKQLKKVQNKNIFSSTQEDESQTQHFLSKMRTKGKQKVLQKQQKKTKQISKKLMLYDSSIEEQQTNIISSKDQQKFSTNTQKSGKFYTSSKQNKSDHETRSKIQGLQRKIWIQNLIKGVVLENKKKSSQKITNTDDVKKPIFGNIKPETILLTESIIRHMKQKIQKNKDKRVEDKKVTQMSKISQQQQMTDCFSKMSSVSHSVSRRILDKKSVSKNSEIDEEIEIKDQKVFSTNIDQKSQVGENKIAIQNLPFECSLSSIDQGLSKLFDNNRSLSQENKLCILLSSQIKQNQISNTKNQNSLIQNSLGEKSEQSQEASNSIQRVINYSTLTNHVSTTLPDEPSQIVNMDRNNRIQFLNLIRQQSMSTRATQKTQLPFPNMYSSSEIIPPSQQILQDLFGSQKQQQESLQQSNYDQSLSSVNLGLKFQQNFSNKKKISQDSQFKQVEEKKQILGEINEHNVLNQTQKQPLHSQKINKDESKQGQINKQDQKIQLLQQQVIDYYLELTCPEILRSFKRNSNQQPNSLSYNQEIFKVSAKEVEEENQLQWISKTSNSLENAKKQSLILNYDLSSINSPITNPKRNNSQEMKLRNDKFYA